jgi:MoaA/NifB/PqqE/SkfB family radical SAM enzyme
MPDWLANLRPAAPDPMIAANVRPGLYHYVHEREGTITRYHLRIDEDGYGVLLANASAAARLRPSGAIIAKGLLDGEDDATIARRCLSAFRGATSERIEGDVAAVRALIGRLDAPGDNYPILNLADPTYSVPPGRLRKPISADLAVDDPARLVPLLDRLWDLGIPHVTLVADDRPDAAWLVRAVERAEDLGMIAGVRGRGSTLAQGSLIADLAQAGVDHINALYLSAASEIHDRLAGGADHDRAVAMIEQTCASDVCAVAEIALVRATLATLAEALSDLCGRGVHNVGFFAVVADEERAADEALSPSELLQAAEVVETLALEADVRFLWYPPVDFDPTQPLAEQIWRGPRCSGEHAVRVLPNGDIIFPQGPFQVRGNVYEETP